LVGQILATAIYPAELEEANHWMLQHQGLTGDALATEVDKQPWDPSVKALTQFPAVLANMSQNLAWSSELGDAYLNQQQAAIIPPLVRFPPAPGPYPTRSSSQRIVRRSIVTADGPIEYAPRFWFRAEQISPRSPRPDFGKA
jgi:Protein of unknown function (DUF3300)